ncbi:MAG: hypothetical protein GXO86_04295 [Chlorobi bacterium]|nr:hypothetical protein [Chlorobiota bacterium]
MKNTFLFLILLLFLFDSAISQTHRNIYVEDGNNTLFMQEGTNFGPEKFNAKYLDSKWEMGNLQTNNHKLITNVAFMYNVTYDRFEIRADVNPAVMGRIIYDGKVFIFSEFIQNDLVKSGYFELLSEGRNILLKKYYVQTTAAKGGALVGHAAYQNIMQDLYIKKENRPAVLIKKKKSDIVEALGDHRETVEAYIAKNHLKMIKTKDIIQVLNYYSSLGEKE